jgi:hypothetical protein
MLFPRSVEVFLVFSITLSLLFLVYYAMFSTIQAGEEDDLMGEEGMGEGDDDDSDMLDKGE